MAAFSRFEAQYLIRFGVFQEMRQGDSLFFLVLRRKALLLPDYWFYPQIRANLMIYRYNNLNIN
jgi:hypothetical protein